MGEAIHCNRLNNVELCFPKPSQVLLLPKEQQTKKCSNRDPNHNGSLAANTLLLSHNEKYWSWSNINYHAPETIPTCFASNYMTTAAIKVLDQH